VTAEYQLFWEKLKKLDLSQIACKLMHYGWPRQKIARSLMRYLMFLTLVYLYPNTVLVPTQEIDRVWHCHILHTRKYRQDCEMLFGYFIDHEPETNRKQGEGYSGLTSAFAQTRSLFEHHFGEGTLDDLNRFEAQNVEGFKRVEALSPGGAGHPSACGRPS